MRRLLPTLLLLCLAPWPARAESLEAGGFLKGAFFLLDFPRTHPGLPGDSFDVEAGRGRLDVKGDLGPLHWEISPEARILTAPGGSAGMSFVAFGGRPVPGLLDLERTFFDRDGEEGTLALDRLWCSFRSGPMELAAGRQPVGFGASLFWAPTDLAAPFSPAELDREVRPGTDALRLIWTPGRFTEFGALFAPGRAFEKDTSLAYARFSARGADFFLIGGTARELPAAGGSVTGEALGAGLRLEGLVLGAGEDEADGARRATSVELIGGFDYRFAGGLYLACEYLYSGAGSSRPREYPAVAASEPYALGLVPFLGRHYLMARLAGQLHPLVEPSLTAFWNMSDGSVLVWPQASISISDDLQGVIFLFLPWGRTADRTGLDRSEYGSSPRAFGAFVTWSFQFLP